MYRRVVSLLLLPFVLMSQSVTFGHCPGGSAAGHDPRPHIHLNAESSCAKDSRRASCGHCHHHGDPPQAEEGDPIPTPDHAPCQKGSDALFFGPGDPVVVESAKAEVEDGASVWWIAVEATTFPCFTDPARPSSFRFSHAPPPACPLYVRHLALLI